MKKVLVAILVASLLFAAIIPLSATTSPVKDYATAANGDLLYTVNFRGDDAFTPNPYSYQALEHFSYIPSQDGSSLTVVGVEGQSDTAVFWGGIINGLPANSSTQYTIVYKVRANDKNVADVMNNSVGIGGWTTNNQDFSKSYNNYSNHNTSDATLQRSALSDAHSKITQASSIGPGKNSSGYVMFSLFNNAFDVSNDGFVTMMLEYNVDAGKFTSYILKDDCSANLYAENSWIVLEQQDMVIEGEDAITFFLYSFYSDSVNTTIKDFEIYKGRFIGKVPETSETSAPVTTPAPATTVTETSTTTAAETTVTTTAEATSTEADTTANTTAANTVEEKGGFKKYIALSGIAMVATVGAITAFIVRKK